MKTLALMLAAAATTLAAVATPVIAQTYDDDDIVIVAPGVVRESTGRRTSSGIPMNDLIAQRVITTADLDLRYDGDVDELYRRIRVTAEEACDDISRAASGMLITSDRQCVREAVRDAMAQADELIWVARG